MPLCYACSLFYIIYINIINLFLNVFFWFYFGFLLNRMIFFLINGYSHFLFFVKYARDDNRGCNYQ
ncbi:hypothetical protein predicted by Glimmer/Critica [Salmonella enterica subsp. enterica serovar Weltevreden str. 2007-60-3289-1]|nr:hypothetical protein predicted by Glimmer/Critica [Salmonella enterica subsp. enterica serovar Weltevreden str. 2007-60-3289-1]